MSKKTERVKYDLSYMPTKKIDPTMQFGDLSLGLGMKNGGGGLVIRLRSGGSVTLTLKETEAVIGFHKLLTEVYGWNN